VRLKFPNQSKKNEHWTIIQPIAWELSQPAFGQEAPRNLQFSATRLAQQLV